MTPTLQVFSEAPGFSTSDLRVPGLIDGTDTVSVSKEGYRTHSQQLTMKGDTRFDIQLVQR